MTDNAIEGISLKIKSGSKAIKEKISSIFKFKKASSSSPSQAKSTSIQPNKDKINSNSFQQEKKIFNIQLSEEDKDNVYEINDDDDEEEEEEKVDDNQEDNKNIPPTNSMQITNQAPNEINPLPQDNEDSDEDLNDDNRTCHYLHPKGSVIDVNDIEVHNFIKKKQSKKGMLSRLGFGNKKQAEIEVPYLAFFDENYLYFMKDIECDLHNASYRKIGNKYNLLKLYNAFFDQIDHNRWQIRLEFASSTDITINKSMIFTKESADRFYALLNVYFNRLNMKMSDTAFGQQPNSTP